MLEIKLTCFWVTLVTIDQSWKNMSLNHGEIFADAVIKLLKSICSVISKPLCFSQHDLSLSQTLVLFGDIFQ